MTRRVCERVAARGVWIRAQVSYRDPAGFGCRSMDVPAAELAAEVVYQIGGLRAFAEEAGATVSCVKQHGVLCNRAFWGDGVWTAADGSVTGADGSRITGAAWSLCVHGDVPGTAVLARQVRGALAEAGVGVRACV